MNYLPGVEVGARRLVSRSPEEFDDVKWYDGLTRAKILGGQAEKLDARLKPGNIVCMRLAEVFKTNRRALGPSTPTSWL